MTSTATRTCRPRQPTLPAQRLGDAPAVAQPAGLCKPGPSAEAAATTPVRSTLTRHHVDLVESGSSAVYSRDHQPLGTVEQIFGGPDTAAPQWLTIATGAVTDRTTLVPLTGAWLDTSDVIIAYTAHQLRDAPTVGAEDDLTGVDAARASAYYAHPDHDPAHS